MPDGTEIIVRDGNDMLMNPTMFEQGQRVAKLFASSAIVPDHMKNKTADCFIALHMAHRMNEDPLIVMQNIYIVSGKAGWSAQYMIGRANRSGVFKGRISWQTKGAGDKMEVTAKAILADTGEPVDATASMAMATAEGWTKNPKYKTMPEHMLRWRSATMLIRLYAPEVMLGIPSSDELEDIQPAMRDITPAGAPTADAGEPVDAFEAAAAGKKVIDATSEAAADVPAMPEGDPLDIPEFLDRRGRPA